MAIVEIPIEPVYEDGKVTLGKLPARCTFLGINTASNTIVIDDNKEHQTHE